MSGVCPGGTRGVTGQTCSKMQPVKAYTVAGARHLQGRQLLPAQIFGVTPGVMVLSNSCSLARLRFHARIAAPCDTDHCCEVWPQEHTTRQTSCLRPGGSSDSRWTLVPPQARQGRIVCGSSSFMLQAYQLCPGITRTASMYDQNRISQAAEKINFIGWSILNASLTPEFAM